MLALSIIIVTYNSEAIVGDCLKSLREAVSQIEAEVIVVDNASKDGTTALIQQAFPEVHLIANADNLGFAGANNLALKIAQGQYLLLMNPDVVVRPETLTALIAFLERIPRVGLVGPHTITGTGQVALSAFRKFTPLVVLWQYWGLGMLFPYHGVGKYRRQCENAAEPFPVDWLQGHCLMFRRAVYEQIGGLDEGLFLFAEEPDFCERAANLGWLIYYVPQAVITHYESTTVSRYPLVKMLHYHTSILYFFRKRGQTASVLLLKLGFTLELGLKWLIRLLQNLLHPSELLKAKIDAYPEVILKVLRY